MESRLRRLRCHAGPQGSRGVSPEGGGSGITLSRDGDHGMVGGTRPLRLLVWSRDLIDHMGVVVIAPSPLPALPTCAQLDCRPFDHWASSFVGIGVYWTARDRKFIKDAEAFFISLYWKMVNQECNRLIQREKNVITTTTPCDISFLHDETDQRQKQTCTRAVQLTDLSIHRQRCTLHINSAQLIPITLSQTDVQVHKFRRTVCFARRNLPTPANKIKGFRNGWCILKERKLKVKVVLISFMFMERNADIFKPLMPKLMFHAEVFH